MAVGDLGERRGRRRGEDAPEVRAVLVLEQEGPRGLVRGPSYSGRPRPPASPGGSGVKRGAWPASPSQACCVALLGDSAGVVCGRGRPPRFFMGRRRPGLPTVFGRAPSVCQYCTLRPGSSLRQSMLSVNATLLL